MKLQLSAGAYRTLFSAVAVASATALLAGCAGNVGKSTDIGAEAVGYEYGAPDEEIKEAFAEIDPISLVFQPTAQSESAMNAGIALEFKEEIERLSDGKVTIELVWGQGIASYDEMPDALLDGRLDLVESTPIYYPDQFPKNNAQMSAITLLPNSPLVGELASTAATTEYWFNHPELIAEYSEQGFEPFFPVEPNGQLVAACGEPADQANDWKGAVIRGASSTHMAQIEGLGGSPTSLTTSEVYEALQRGTVDCAIVPYLSVAVSGLAEVAPELNYPTETGFARGPGVYLGGTNLKEAPLAVRQLVFDQGALLFGHSRTHNLEAAAQSATLVREAGGHYNELSDEMQKDLTDINASLLRKEIDAGNVPEDAEAQLAEHYENWLAVAQDMGYQDQGGMEDFDEWFDTETDFSPFAEKLFEDVFLPHRPTE